MQFASKPVGCYIKISHWSPKAPLNHTLSLVESLCYSFNFNGSKPNPSRWVTNLPLLLGHSQPLLSSTPSQTNPSSSPSHPPQTAPSTAPSTTPRVPHAGFSITLFEIYDFESLPRANFCSFIWVSSDRFFPFQFCTETKWYWPYWNWQHREHWLLHFLLLQVCSIPCFFSIPI